MALVRLRKGNELNPWTSFGDLEAQFNRFFAPFKAEAFGTSWVPATDLKETDTEFVIEADVPGLKKEDIGIELIENVVTIKGERKSESERKDANYHHVERSYGAFQRVIELPGAVNGEAVQASFENGTLRIVLPKKEDTRPKRIEVKTN